MCWEHYWAEAGQCQGSMPSFFSHLIDEKIISLRLGRKPTFNVYYFFLSGDLPYLNHQLIVVCHMLVTPTKQVICFALSAHIPRFIRLGQIFTGHDLLIPDTQGMECLPTTRHAFFVVVFHTLPSPLLIVQAHCAFLCAAAARSCHSRASQRPLCASRKANLQA